MLGWTIYQGNLDALQGRPRYGTGDCVALIQAVTNIGHTSGWKKGPRVIDMQYLNVGAVIANFVNGRYPNEHGYHVALFDAFRRNPGEGRAFAISVMDQFKRREDKVVQRRDILARGERTHAEGNPYWDCDNATHYYVVML